MTASPLTAGRAARTCAITPRRKNRAGREGYKVNWWLTALMLVASLTVLLPL
jgi:raffinose/stachyose/melibiose transport system permease protein